MSQKAVATTTPDIHSLITEDDTPVDSLPSEKQQRLLTETLYSSWTPDNGQTFLVAANVGIFAQARKPPIVPDVFVSLDVEVAAGWWQKEQRSYFLWEFGKPPEIVIDIVANREGGENEEKLQKYARMRVQYYVIYDPLQQIMPDPLTIYCLYGMRYEHQVTPRFRKLGLGVTLWDGTYEEKEMTWLRWTDEQGRLIPTGKERAEQERRRAEQEQHHAEQERRRAEQERQRADREHVRAEQEWQRAERLAAMLRRLGHDPSQI